MDKEKKAFGYRWLREPLKEDNIFYESGPSFGHSAPDFRHSTLLPFIYVSTEKFNAAKQKLQKDGLICRCTINPRVDSEGCREEFFVLEDGGVLLAEYLGPTGEQIDEGTGYPISAYDTYGRVVWPHPDFIYALSPSQEGIERIASKINLKLVMPRLYDERVPLSPWEEKELAWLKK
jgi:hypothetical protein